MRFLLHQLLQASAERAPDAVAVVDGGRQISYGELDSRANQLARLLIAEGVLKGERIGLFLDKSLESVVGLYGILKAGAAYVPVDPQSPTARVVYILDNCGVRVLLTGKEKSSAWPELEAGCLQLETLVVLNAGSDAGLPEPGRIRVRNADELATHPASSPSRLAIELDLAYILYTSGSTGQPKGVMLTHLNALTFVNWTVDRFAIRPDDRLSNHAPLHFDLSIFDLFAAAKAGATVVLVPPRTSVFPVHVAKFIEENRITVWYSVPSVLSMLALRGNLQAGAFPHLRTLLFAGEVFPTKYLRQLMQALPQVRFFNLYGPTETNVCTYFEVPALPDDRTETIPIGKAIDNVEVFAVTDAGNKAMLGEPGELYVRGSSLMQGYWGDPERSARALFANPFGEGLADHVYRTGDLVIQETDGNFRLLGRRDAQIKSRGYRIELGEIESALYAHPSVIECAVVAIPDELVTNKIKAYVVGRDHLTDIELSRFCGDRIPSYMIPETYEFREALPKTSTGKIDRRALSPSGGGGNDEGRTA
jgi:amino acid adenylation domain-containing protein